MKKTRQIESHETYDIWEVVLTDNDPTQPPLVTAMAFSKDGGCIGDRKEMREFLNMGIKPERNAATGTDNANIGWQEKDKKWWGWSHRAKSGFGIGSTVEKGSVLVPDYPVGYKVKTLADAKKMALRFAESVS